MATRNRAHFLDYIMLPRTVAGVEVLSLVGGATYNLYQPGTVTAITQTLYTAATGGTTFPNTGTLPSDAKCEFYADEPFTARLRISGAGITTTDFEIEILRSGQEEDDEVVNVKSYGALGDGGTNDTTAIQTAVDVAAPGGVVLFPSGTYVSGNITITNATNLTIRGDGAKINWTGSGAGVGFQLVGTCTNVTVRDLWINGDGVAANNHQSVWAASGQTLTNIKVLNNRISNVTVGVSLNADTGGSVTGGLIEGNYIDTAVGTASGQGYGIHHANGSGNASHVRIIGNTVTGAQRHSIYQAKGSGVVIAGNTIRNHRSGVADGGLRAALVVSRSQDVTVTGNVIDTFSDGGIEVSPTAGFTTRNIIVADNTISNPQNTVPSMWIGGLDPAADGTPTDVVVSGNSFYQSGVAVGPFRVYACKRLLVYGNLFVSLAAASAQRLIDLFGQGEGAGTANYSDEIQLIANQLRGTTNGGSIDGIRIDTAFATSAAVLRCIGNIGIGINATFQSAAPITNTNITVFGQPVDGISFSGATTFAAYNAGGILANLTTRSPLTINDSSDNPKLALQATGAERGYLQYTTSSSILRLDSDGSLDLAANNAVALSLTTAGITDIKNGSTALGGGAAPTLGTIGGSGPATAAQHSWLKIKINGTDSFIPVWR